MIYLHFERSTLNPSGYSPVEIVCLIFSSGPNQANISWNYDKDAFEVYKKLLLQIPSSQRSYDPKTHIWTIKADKFKLIETLFSDNQKVEYNSKSSLSNPHKSIHYSTLDQFVTDCAQAKAHRFKYTHFECETKTPNAEDFFYTKSQPVSSTQMPLEQVRTKLFDLIGAPAQPSIGASTNITSVSIDDIKVLTKLYRQAALKYHPDRNNGDATKMSQLNMLWQQYKTLIGA